MFKVVINFSDGEVLDFDEEFETEAEAQSYGYEQLSNMDLGAEILHMSNPGDYPLPDNDGEPEVVVTEVD